MMALPDLENPQRSLELHRYRHLAFPDPPVLEEDGDLLDTQTDLLSDVAHLYLKYVAVRADSR